MGKMISIVCLKNKGGLENEKIHGDGKQQVHSGGRIYLQIWQYVRFERQSKRQRFMQK
jgi:hypothetical protein